MKDSTLSLFCGGRFTPTDYFCKFLISNLKICRNIKTNICHSINNKSRILTEKPIMILTNKLKFRVYAQSIGIKGGGGRLRQPLKIVNLFFMS